MDFLIWLESLRTPVMNGFMAAITYLGEETFFMAFALLIFWCINKRSGYFLLTTCFFGLIFNQFMKLWFRIPRPWVQNKKLTIVEAAREGAAGYSFPSGHTQNIVSITGVTALSFKQVWVRVLSIVLMLLVPFSRLYLGVHTPLDVGVGFSAALALTLLLYPCFRDEGRMKQTMPFLIIALIVLGIAYALFAHLYPFQADVDKDNLASGQKNAFTVVGSAIGFLVVYLLDEKKIRFDTAAPLAGQILKYVIGLGLLVGIRAGLKVPLQLLLPEGYWETGIRYFVIVVFAGAVWPLSFPLFKKIGARRQPKAQE